MRAILTGAKGNLGPIWKDELTALGYAVDVLDLPGFNVSDAIDVKRFAAAYRSKGYGPPDVIVNNAAYDPKPSEAGDGDFWDFGRCIDVNLIGALNVCREFVPYMASSMKGGLVINIGSIMGNSGADWRNYPPHFQKSIGYNVSKAALIQLSRSICTQFGRADVRAITISFGPYDSGLPEDFKVKFLKNVPLGRTISEKSLRSTLRFALTCPELSGQQVLVDGGLLAW